MNINATLFGQMITFALFVWFTMRFVWPPIQVALEKRKETIAEGLAAAERGHYDLSLAQEKAKKILKEARQGAEQALDDARQSSERMVDAAKEQAKEEAKRILERAQEDIKQLENDVRLKLKKDVSALVLFGAEKILAKQIDPSTHQDLLDQLIKEL